MFCDLVGSTALSLQLDPEDLWQVIGAYHTCVARTIGRYDGFVAKYMGDGVLVYFGYPQAHEDDAERAVQAGLALVEAGAEIATANSKLALRIGIGTGIVLVGDLIGEGSAQEQAIVGDTPNLAARLQALAEPNAVVIGPRTRRLLGDLFEYRDLGSFELRGFTEPGRAYQVLHQSAIESRFEALRSEATPLVGRDKELDLLLERWHHVKSGEGQVVLICGEPGIGKSRLVATVSQRIQGDAHIRLRYFCSPHHQNSALYPLIAQLECAAGFARDDTVEAKLGKLRSLLVRGARDEHEIALLAELLSLPIRADAENLSPRRKREMLFEAELHQFEALARRRPILMVFEDAHWSDPTSRELLDLTLDRVPQMPVLLLVTFRPEFQHAWRHWPHVTTLTLNRLGERDGAALVEGLAGNAGISRETVNEIVERADGVPLFVEELTKAVLESANSDNRVAAVLSANRLPSLAIPATLHASLIALLDRLGATAKRVAQIGAAIGREFPFALLHAVSSLPEEELQASLARLVGSELMFQRGISPNAIYRFNHALVQEVAHGTLVRGARQQLHAQITKALEAQSPELIDSQPELLAQHSAEAGFVEKSIAYWGRAGRRSAALSAMAEAAAQFKKGLDQLALLPDNAERLRQKLEFWSALGAVLMAAKGQAAPEAGDAYSRARELWEELGSPPEFLHVSQKQSIYHMYRGEFDLAKRLNKDLLRLSRQHNDSAGLVLGLYSSGLILMYAGEFASSRSHLEEMLALYDPISHHSLVRQTGFHLQLVSQAISGIVLFCLGFPDQALAQSNAAIVAAQGLAHPQSLAVALLWGTRLLLLAGDNAAADERADQLAAVATEQGFSFWGAQATIYRGWIKAKNGDVTEGMRLLRSGSAAHRAAGAEAVVPYFNALLASAYEIAGQVEEALAQLDNALQIIERTGEQWFEAELHRRKGQLLLRSGHTEAAEELYCKALGIAKEQQAKLWELRAAASLARLWGEQGRRAEAPTSSRPFTAGSPKVSTPPTCKRPRHSSRNWHKPVESDRSFARR